MACGGSSPSLRIAVKIKTRRKFFSGGILGSKPRGGRFDPCTACFLWRWRTERPAPPKQILTTRPSGEAGSCNLPGSWFDSSRRLCDRSSIGRAPGCDPGRCGFESHRSPWRNWRPLKRTLHHFDHRFHDAGFRFQIRIKLPRQPRQVGAMGDPGRGVDLPCFDQLDDPREIAR